MQDPYLENASSALIIEVFRLATKFSAIENRFSVMLTNGIPEIICTDFCDGLIS